MICDPQLETFLKALPVDWEHSIPYGILHSSHPSPAVERFLSAAAQVRGELFGS